MPDGHERCSEVGELAGRAWSYMSEHEHACGEVGLDLNQGVATGRRTCVCWTGRRRCLKVPKDCRTLCSTRNPPHSPTVAPRLCSHQVLHWVGEGCLWCEGERIVASMQHGSGHFRGQWRRKDGEAHG